LFACALIGAWLSFFTAPTATAEQEPSDSGSNSSAADDPGTADKLSQNGASTAAGSKNAQPAAGESQPPGPGGGEKPKYPPYSDVLKDAQMIDGLLTLHRKDDKLFAELAASNFEQDYIVLITIARGIGQTPILGGFSWGFGDDWIWQFRCEGEQVHVVRRNVRFTADDNSPESKAVDLAYTDSVLFSLPIATKSPSGGVVIDLTPVFMSDLPQISQELAGFSISPSRSTWADVKGFRHNMEIEVAATYASGGQEYIESVSDTRGVTINVHYSISKLPPVGSYQPRLADDRIGYFLTVIKDFSKKDPQDRFVRYINRWDMQKADSAAELSPPKKAIVFWLERTIPYKYRKPIREGIEEWNRAFEKLGFANAIEVRQQPDVPRNESDEWDPADIEHNTFRWITSGAGFAMGPSRVDPRTGQILDADIIFDADFLQFWRQEYETFTPKGIELLTGGPIDIDAYRKEQEQTPFAGGHRHGPLCMCNLLSGKSYDLAMAHAVMAARTRNEKDLEKLIVQALKVTTMHEVGHTLGLRHNFKASTFYSLEDANDPSKTSKTGLAASVMDYTPVNMRPRDREQGDYYSTTIGPYDYWAIEYGYQPLSGGTEGELEKLKGIAARSGEPGHAFATDENTRGIDPDPLANRWDFSDDPLAYARLQAKIVAETWPGVIDEMTEDGEGYQQARRAFGILLGTHGRAMFLASRYIGGLHISRSHKGDKDAPPPFKIVSAAEQREALEILEKQVFSDEPFCFPPDLYSHLAPTYWSHWGSEYTDRADYPAHEVILMWQERILSKLLSSLTLARLHDAELKVSADEDALTVAELIERLTGAIFAETETVKSGEFTNRKPAISSLRRNLQRKHLDCLADLALGRSGAPEDAQTIAYAELSALQVRIDKLLERDVKLDSYSRAHLQETTDRIEKVLDAHITQLP
jgi:hypothetical protein